jgi:hypothetical protein
MNHAKLKDKGGKARKKKEIEKATDEVLLVVLW